MLPFCYCINFDDFVKFYNYNNRQKTQVPFLVNAHAYNAT